MKADRIPDITAIPERFVTPRDQHVDHHAEAKHVGGWGSVVAALGLTSEDIRNLQNYLDFTGFSPPCYLGCHEANSATEGDLGVTSFIQVFCQTKIYQFDLKVI